MNVFNVIVETKYFGSTGEVETVDRKRLFIPLDLVEAKRFVSTFKKNTTVEIKSSPVPYLQGVNSISKLDVAEAIEELLKPFVK